MDDLFHLVFSNVNEQIDSLENKSIANITVYGKTEVETSTIIGIVKKAVDEYLTTFTNEYYIPKLICKELGKSEDLITYVTDRKATICVMQST